MSDKRRHPFLGITHALWREFKRWRMRSLLRKDCEISLKEAACLWSLSDLIYLGPTGPNARRLPEWNLYEAYCASPTPPDEELLTMAKHASPAVAGYAFEVLLARNSRLIPEALELLLPRTESVSGSRGSFVSYLELGGYALHRYEIWVEKDQAAAP